MVPDLLVVRGLRKRFGGIRAVDGVDLTLAAGVLHGLIGPNGAGKTTLFHLLTGIVRPDAGRVHLRGVDMTAWSPYRIWRQGLSRTFQLPACFANLSVRENVQVALLSMARQAFLLGRDATRMWRLEAEDLLAEVGLKDQANKLAGTLPYGDIKRLELAMALANQPAVLLLDEPTAGLAMQERGTLVRLVQAIVKQRGVTVLFTEHDMDVVFTLAQSLTVLHQGQVLAVGTPEAVRANADVQRVYLGSAS